MSARWLSYWANTLVLMGFGGQVGCLCRDRAAADVVQREERARIHGITLVAPPEPFAADPMPPLRQAGANWVAVVPYAFTRPGTPTVCYAVSGWQWWGERPEGVCETVQLAHEAGLRVMLKPQLYLFGCWTGQLAFDDDDHWRLWEEQYAQYILDMARLADSFGVELFCVGTELRASVAQRPAFWSALIAQVRQVYRGALTYSANWDDWEAVPFWGQLDYIGLSAYFPLVQSDTPSLQALKAAWKPHVQRLRSFSQRWQKPVLFTEFGYLSVDGAGGRTWELEKRVQHLPINECAQANCIEALLSTFQREPWWAGGFLWKWFPNLRGHEGYPERDYTPQGKQAEQTLRRWYRRH